MIISPLRASTDLPSTSMVTISSFLFSTVAIEIRFRFRLQAPNRPGHMTDAVSRHSYDDLGALAGHHGIAVLDIVFEFFAEVAQKALYGPGCGLAEGANGVPLDLRGYRTQHIKIFHAPLAGHDAVNHAVHPAGAFATRRALAAGFGVVKARNATGSGHNFRSFVHDNDRARAHARAGLLYGVIVHGQIHHDIGRSTGMEDPPGITALSLLPLRTPPAI